MSDASPRETLPAFAHRMLFAVPLVAGALVVACSSNSPESSGDQGSVHTGGTAANITGGGATGGTRANTSGGASATATGGTSSVSPPTGGASTADTKTTGGVTGTGGKPTTGGATGTGGKTATGGAPGSGGTTVLGGAPGAGGSSIGGGTSSSGGANPTGGRSSTGGASVTGGVSAGGANSGGTSGKVTTGGSSAATGGTTSTSTSTSYMPCPTTAGAVCNVMPIGDSITEGCCTAPMGGYRIELFRQASTNKKALTFVGTLTNGPTTVDGKTFPQHHEGHGGWKISQIAGVADNAIKSSKPHIVLLKIGTNDINGNDNIADAPNRLANLIDQITKDVPDALLVVSSIIPSKTDGTNNNFRNYNTAIKAKAEAAAAAGKHVVFVDNYQAFAQNTNFKTAYMSDNLHPNDAGYAVLGKSFYSVISGVLPTSP